MGSSLDQAGLYLIHLAAGVFTFLLVLRFLMRATFVSWNNQIVMFIAKVTNPVALPLSKVIPSKGRWDFAALIAAYLIQVLLVIVIAWMQSKNPSFAFYLMFALTEILNFLLDMIFWLIIIQAVLSWVMQTPNPNLEIFFQITAPILAPFRKIIPPISGIDISPIVAIVAIKLTQILIVGNLVALTYTLG